MNTPNDNSVSGKKEAQSSSSLTSLQDKQKKEEDALRAETPTTRMLPNEETGLLQSCMELREAVAACFRVIDRFGPKSVTMLEKELRAAQIADGFGIRAQCAIAKAQSGASGNARETTKEAK